MNILKTLLKVIGGVVGFFLMVAVVGACINYWMASDIYKRQQAKHHDNPRKSQEEVIQDKLQLQFSWSKSGFGNIAVADLKISNFSNTTIKDPTVRCSYYGKSGTTIDHTYHVIYETIPAHSVKSFPEQNMGFVHSQSNTAGCIISNFKILPDLKG